MVLVVWTGTTRAQNAEADSARAALERELAAFSVELDDAGHQDDPFAAGRVPDLIIAGTADVYGEVGPCG